MLRRFYEEGRGRAALVVLDHFPRRLTNRQNRLTPTLSPPGRGSLGAGLVRFSLNRRARSAPAAPQRCHQAGVVVVLRDLPEVEGLVAEGVM